VDQRPADEIVLAICDKFKLNSEGKPAVDLAIMPDVAPSTLLGEKWMIYLARESLDEPADGDDPMRAGADDPMKVKGMLGETEQWLWAANRTIGKLRRTIEDHKPGVNKDHKPGVNEASPNGG
jgi:hypothetical protein